MAKVKYRRREGDYRNEQLRDMVVELDEEGINLSEWEVEFIGGFIDGDVFTFTEKQEVIIRRIYEERLK